MKVSLKGVVFFLILVSNFKFEVSAQTKTGRIISFHPSVGNSITVDEKKQFGVFTEYTDSLFQSAQLISYDSSGFEIQIATTTGQSFTRPFSKEERDAIYKKIESIKPFETIVEPAEDDYVVKKADAGDTAKRKDHSQAWMTAIEISLNVLFVFLEVMAN